MSRLLILFLFLSWRVSVGQFQTYLEGGYGLYMMEDMKDLQQELVLESGVSLESSSAFPPYFNYGIQMGYKLESKLEMGLTYRFFSTGAGSGYSDYSGSASIDQLLRAYSIGLYVSKQINKSITWPMVLSVNISRIHTTVDIESSLVLGNNEPASDIITLEGNGWGASVSLMFQRNFTRNLFAFGKLGLEAFANKELLFDDIETDLKADWSGPRVGLGLGFILHSRNSNDQP